MADVRITKFENFPMLGDLSVNGLQAGGNLNLHYVYVPGSISFNSVQFHYELTMTSGTRTVSVSFALYSLTGSTWSLANSASTGLTFSTNASSWWTMETSATQDITPGDWMFGMARSRDGGGGVGAEGFVCNSHNGAGEGAYGGPAFRGVYNSTTNAMPGSMHTSRIAKESSTGNTGDLLHPYIVISA